MMTFSRLSQMTLMLALVGTLGLAVGCAREDRVQPRPASLDLEASRTSVLVGENTTVTAFSEGTLGREAQVEWDASGGELFTEANGRLARVYFDRPGEYIVQANLILDGRLADTSQVTITVDDIRNQ